MSRLPAQLWGGDEDLDSIPLTPAVLRSVDCVAILTDHTAFDIDQIRALADVIVDTRNVTAGRSERVFRLGAPIGLAAANPVAV